METREQEASPQRKGSKQILEDNMAEIRKEDGLKVNYLSQCSSKRLGNQTSNGAYGRGVPNRQVS